jgi:hypothetical protein
MQACLGRNAPSRVWALPALRTAAEACARDLSSTGMAAAAFSSSSSSSSSSLDSAAAAATGAASLVCDSALPLDPSGVALHIALRRATPDRVAAADVVSAPPGSQASAFAALSVLRRARALACVLGGGVDELRVGGAAWTSLARIGHHVAFAPPWAGGASRSASATEADAAGKPAAGGGPSVRFGEPRHLPRVSPHASTEYVTAEYGWTSEGPPGWHFRRRVCR